MKLKNKQIRKTVALPFNDIHSDDGWIIEEGDEIEQVQGAYNGQNVHLDEGTRDRTLDALDLII